MRLEKLDQHGDSYAVVIEQSILDELGIDDDTLLEMHIEGASLIFTPVTPERRREIIREATQNAMDRYGDAFRRMAAGEEPPPKE
ncbi:MAG: AbrB/MazE/SpoVT family DNA-binding domain-containing protein [Armatimonadota bacterium]